MNLAADEQAMLAGEQGPVRQWAIRHQISVGEFFDADLDSNFISSGFNCSYRAR